MKIHTIKYNSDQFFFRVILNVEYFVIIYLSSIIYNGIKSIRLKFPKIIFYLFTLVLHYCIRCLMTNELVT